MYDLSKVKNMQIIWSNKKLQRIYEDDTYNPKGYHPRVIDGFVDTVAFMEDKTTTQEIRALKRLHYEKLEAPYKNNEHSVRIWVAWRRLIFIPTEKWNFKIIDIIDLDNHTYRPKK